MKNINRTKLDDAGYFFHAGGDMTGELNNPKKRGIWKNINSPLQAYYVGMSWEDARVDYNRTENLT